MGIHENDNRRFFIVTVGRTGSSLLASILADAGADFGVQGKADWDPAGGAYEHPSLVPVIRKFERMNEIGFRRPYGKAAGSNPKGMYLVVCSLLGIAL